MCASAVEKSSIGKTGGRTNRALGTASACPILPKKALQASGTLLMLGTRFIAFVMPAKAGIQGADTGDIPLSRRLSKSCAASVRELIMGEGAAAGGKIAPLASFRSHDTKELEAFPRLSQNRSQQLLRRCQSTH
jgi:hypothetical protein